MVGGHRHLGGADEVEVLALDPVDVVGGLAEEAGAVHGPRAHQRRSDDLGEAGLPGLLHREVDQRQLELGADAGEEVEPAARHLGAALDVDRAQDPAELDVVAGLEALGLEVTRRADMLEHDEVVLAALGRLGGREVRDLLQGALPGLLGLAAGGLGGLDLGGQRLGLREQLLLLLALGLRDEGPELLLLGALLLERGDRCAAGGVGLQGA